MDDEKTMHGVHMMIRSEIGSVLCRGLEPKRIYMNGRTRDLFISQCSMILHEIVIAEKDKKERQGDPDPFSYLWSPSLRTAAVECLFF